MLRVMIAAATSWVVIALAVVFALFLTAAAARAHGRRLERRMVAQLGRRWDQGETLSVDAGPRVRIDARVGVEAKRPPEAELQITLEDLLSQRDVLLEEFQTVQAQITLLKRRADRRRPAAKVTEKEENVIRLHDVLPEEWAERRRR
jgi:hypothetical protein